MSEETNRKQELVDEVRGANQRLLEATGNSSRAFIELGQYLNRLKEEFNGEKKRERMD
jgi:hypothetical protein